MTRGGLGFWRWVAVLLFSYVLARPVSNNMVLVPVLAALGLLAAGALVFGRGRRLALPLVPPLFVTFVFGVLGLLVGSSDPGFTGALLVFIAAPLLYWSASTAVDERLLRAGFFAAAIVTIYIGVTITVYVAASTGTIPQVLPEWLLEETGAGFAEAGYTQVRYYGLSTLVATGPMWAASLFVRKDSLLPPQWLRAVATLCAIAAGLSAGRRALVVVLVLAPAIAWLTKILIARRGQILRVDARWLIAAVAAVTVTVAAAPTLLSGPVVTSTWESLTSYITGSQFVGADAQDDQIRSYQAGRLLDEWAEAPVFGHGFGATIQGYARSAEEPWRWELQYHALLFQTGVVGALLVVLGALLTFNAAIMAARARPSLMPSLVVACAAAAGMLIGNATNPYLQAPGYVWAIFLPVAVMNVMLLREDESEAGRPGLARAPGLAAP